MADERTLEIVVDTVDENTVSDLEKDLTGLGPKRSRPTRDLVTVLTIVSTVVTIVKTLLEIRDKLKKKAGSKAVRIRNAERDELDLLTSSDEEIERFVGAAPEL